MGIEIVDLPIKNGDFPSFFVCLPEGMGAWWMVNIVVGSGFFSPKFRHPILPWFIDFIIMVDVYEIDWTRKNMLVFVWNKYFYGIYAKENDPLWHIITH